VAAFPLRVVIVRCWNHLLLLLVIGIAHVPAWAQEVYQVEELSIDQGIFGLCVAEILQDRDGFMWFGSWGGGLTRYDGYETVNYTRDRLDSTSIFTTDPTSLWQDSQGRIWTGSELGISIFHADRESFTNLTAASGGSWSFVEEDSLNYWAAAGSGLYRISEKGGEFIIREYPTQEGKGPREADSGVVLCSTGGEIWFSNSQGLYRFDTAKNDFDHFPAPASLSGAISTAILGTGDRVWLGTNGAGLWSFDVGKGAYVPFELAIDAAGVDLSTIWKFFEVEGTQLLFFGYPGELIKLNTETGSITKLVDGKENEFAPT